MTEPTPQPSSAKSVRVAFYGEGDARAYYPDEISLMHTHTEDWLKHFAERVKGEVKGFFYEDGAEIITPIDKVSIDSLLSEVTAKMKEGKP